MGRLAKPTKLKLLAGNPGKRPLNDTEPESPPLDPEPPAWLKEGEKEFWEDLVGVLLPMGHVTKADRVALALLSTELARYREVCKKVNSEGLTILGPEGEKVSPYVRVAAAAFKNVFQAIPHFGMSPSSRSKIVAKAAGEEDPLAKFLSGGKKKSA